MSKNTKNQEPPQEDELEVITPTISCHDLVGINTPKNLKIERYVKNRKVTVLTDLGSTCNFIHCKVPKDLNFFVYPAPEFQVMIADGGTINCSGKFHNINLIMGEYVLNNPIISIPMGGVNVVLGVHWLQLMGTIDGSSI